MNRKIGINFDWRYSPDFRKDYLSPDFDDSSFKSVQIPHSNCELPFNNFRQNIFQFESCYRKRLLIERSAEDERVFICFEGVMTKARVFMNGMFCGEHSGGYTAFRFDVTEAVRNGSDNILAVHVDSRELDDVPPFGHVVDYLGFGGIYREVSLEYCDSVHIETAVIKPRNVLGTEPVLEADLYLRNLTGAPGILALNIKLLFNGTEVIGFDKKIDYSDGGNETISLRQGVQDVRLWDIEDPCLYELEINALRNGREAGTYRYRFGFRDVDYRADGFYLNGKRLKLRGLNRHQSFPYAGYAMPAGVQRRDAEILKYELGVNTVRSSHYPQSRHFLDRCDEIGLLVFDEIPGWQHIGDEKWKQLSIDNLEAMIKTDANHPSVFIWGVRINESKDDDDFYRRTNETARRLDSTRPTGGVRCSRHGSLLEDVYTYNDFSHSGKNPGLLKRRKVVRGRVPYLVTEHNGHMFPTKKFDDEAHRLSHAGRHLAVLDAMYGSPDISGAIGWCMFDYNTHKDFGSGDKICYHGVTDAFRIPKYAAYVYSSQQSEKPVMEIAGSMNIGEKEASLPGAVWIFTNCDYIKMYKNGELINTFYPQRELYPNVPHPPVIIEDLVGDQIEKNEAFSHRDAALIKKLLMKIGKNGGKLSLPDTIRAGFFLMKTGLTYQDAEDLYTRYFGGWGGEAVVYRFEGYLEDERVIERTVEQDTEPRLVLNADKLKLTEAETWDAVRCTVELVDGHGNSLVYANDAFSIRTEGPLEIIGPGCISLVGGSTGFWIRTAGKSGAARLILESERYGRKTMEFEVVKIPEKT